MFSVKENNYPLERLISLRKRVSYQLLVRDQEGKSSKLLCEFQTHADYVFSARRNKFELGSRVFVRTVTLKGAMWQPCDVTYIEEHIGYALYQLTVVVAKTAAIDKALERSSLTS